MWWIWTLAAQAAPLHYVVVGNGNYVEEAQDGWASWSALPSAGRSVHRVSAQLAQMGGVGDRLDGTAGARVGREDILKAVEARARKARRDPDAPLLVVYVMSHGLSEGIAFSHFSIPENVLRPAEFPDVVEFAEVALYAGEMVEMLNAAGVPYLLLLDSCYEANDVSFQSPVLTSEAEANLQMAAGILRHINQFHQSNPVVFSARPGAQVTTAVDPVDPTGQVGPLARRFLLATQPVLKDGETMKLEDVVVRLTDPQFDAAVTTPAHSTPQNVYRYAFRAGQGTAPTRLGGTSTSAVWLTSHTSGAEAAPLELPPNLKLQFAGPDGDWVSKGASVDATTFAEIPPTMAADGSYMELYFLDPEERLGAIAFSGVKGRPIEVGSTHDVMLASDEKLRKAGFSLAFDGAACSAVKGSTTIETVERNADGMVTRFAAHFEQSCDGGPPLRGSVSWGP